MLVTVHHDVTYTFVIYHLNVRIYFNHQYFNVAHFKMLISGLRAQYRLKGKRSFSLRKASIFLK